MRKENEIKLINNRIEIIQKLSDEFLNLIKTRTQFPKYINNY